MVPFLLPYDLDISRSLPFAKSSQAVQVVVVSDISMVAVYSPSLRGVKQCGQDNSLLDLSLCFEALK